MTELQRLYELQLELEDSIKAVKKEIEKKQIFTEKLLEKYGFKLQPAEKPRYKTFMKFIPQTRTRVEIVLDIINPTNIVIFKGDGFTESGFEFEIQCEADLAKLLVQAKVM